VIENNVQSDRSVNETEVRGDRNMIEIDAAGLSCPEPIILLKNAARDHDEIKLTVDNRASAAACARFAESRGFSAETERTADGYALIIKRVNQ